jgi:AraC-like DNA-binding protein
MDREFMKKLLSVVEKHISDAKFSVTQLGSEMNMSVSQLNRKLKAIIDQSPQKFIRSIRMQRALEMLNNNTGNISEISWEVGFEDPGYFSRVFKMHFGYPPSEVKSE